MEFFIWIVWRYQREVIRSRKSKKDKRTNNDLQNITKKAKEWPIRIPLKTGVELRYSGRVSSSCSTCGTRRVTVKRHECIQHSVAVPEKGWLVPIYHRILADKSSFVRQVETVVQKIVYYIVKYNIYINVLKRILYLFNNCPKHVKEHEYELYVAIMSESNFPLLLFLPGYNQLFNTC